MRMGECVFDAGALRPLRIGRGLYLYDRYCLVSDYRRGIAIRVLRESNRVVSSLASSPLARLRSVPMDGRSRESSECIKSRLLDSWRTVAGTR